jgi:uncharacterized protein YdbL (DUF1318 family)
MRSLTLLLLVIATLGCAKVNLQTSQPIKLDINMRVDVYQHVAKDIDDIENIVSGGKKQAQPKEGQSMLNYFIGNVYAQDNLSPEVEEAALRRQARFSEVYSLEASAVLGENNSGLIEIRDMGRASASLEKLVNDENSDRVIIYAGVAKKNGTSTGDVQKIYAQKLQGNAPRGTPIQDSSGAWKVK